MQLPTRNFNVQPKTNSLQLPTSNFQLALLTVDVTQRLRLLDQFNGDGGGGSGALAPVFDQDREGDLGIFGRGKANEPGIGPSCALVMLDSVLVDVIDYFVAIAVIDWNVSISGARFARGRDSAIEMGEGPGGGARQHNQKHQVAQL